MFNSPILGGLAIAVALNVAIVLIVAITLCTAYNSNEIDPDGYPFAAP